MLGLVAERAGHAAAGRLERLDSEAWDQLQGLCCGLDGAECLLVAVTVQQCRPAFHRVKCQLEATGRPLTIDEFLDQLGALGKRLCSRARQHRRKLVAQRQQARRLQPDDRRAGRDVRRECV